MHTDIDIPRSVGASQCARPQPTAVRPQPTAVRPQPTAVRPQPTAVRPQPTAVRPQPTAVRPGTKIIAMGVDWSWATTLGRPSDICSRGCVLLT